MKKCFVIQRFDGGPYDRRFLETFAPAIEAGGASPIRADQILGTRPVIDKIESSLREADIAFCDASEDNANVFLELGYALALNVPTVIICDKAKRQNLSFDISHRTVIFYSTESQSDFEKLGDNIRENISAALLEARTAMATSTTIRSIPTHDDVDEIIRLCLMEYLEQDLRSPSGASMWDIEKRLARGMITSRMIALATTHLIGVGYLERFQTSEDSFTGPSYSYRITEAGRTELLRSYRDLIHTEFENMKTGRHLVMEDMSSDDDIPF